MITRILCSSLISTCLVLAACATNCPAPSPRTQNDPKVTESSPPRAKTDAPADPRLTKAQLDEYMPEHFAIITWARDSVINGELDALREPLRALASYEYRDLDPGPWLAPIAGIQQTARLGAEARTLPLAAAAVAAMARQCGNCHREAGYTIDTGALEPFREDDLPETLAGRMQRHSWAADRMWEGLVMPSERAWFQGASALANAPSELPPAEGPIPPKVGNALAELRALGTQALDAEDWEARIDAYARLLVSCSACHSSVEVP